MESNIANVIKANNNFHESITTHKQGEVSIHPDGSKYHGDDLGERVRSLSEEFHQLPLFRSLEIR